MKGIKAVLFSIDNPNEKNKKEWILEKGRTYKIGRNADKTHITVNDGTISRIHAELEFTNFGKILIRDLGSANGTYIDEIQVNQKGEYVEPNQKINLGESKYFILIKEFEIENEKDKQHRDSSSSRSSSRPKNKKKHRENSSLGSRKRSRSRHKTTQNKNETDQKLEASSEKLQNTIEEKIAKQEKYIPTEKQTNTERLVNEEPLREIPQRYEYQPHFIKYYEEFLKLKQAEMKNEIKQKLPKLIDIETLKEQEKSKKNFPERSLISKHENEEDVDKYYNSKYDTPGSYHRTYKRFTSNNYYY